MRHQVHGKKLGRNTMQRKSLMKNLVQDLVEHGEIHTTEAKAKAIRGLVDSLIHKAQEGSISTRRLLAAFFGTHSIVHRLVDEVAPAMKDRVSGFTRIIRLGNRRGDNSMMVKMELIKKPEAKAAVVTPKKVAAPVKASVVVPEIAGEKKSVEKTAVKKAAPAKKVKKA